MTLSQLFLTLCAVCVFPVRWQMAGTVGLYYLLISLLPILSSHGFVIDGYPENDLPLPENAREEGSGLIPHRDFLEDVSDELHEISGKKVARWSPVNVLQEWANGKYLLGYELDDIEYKSLGCFRDTHNRAIPSLEGSDPRLDGYYLTREDALNKCANVASRRGFDVFGVQNNGWCASSENAGITYDKYGPSSACKNEGEGGPFANEIYAIVKSKIVCENQRMDIDCSHGTIHVVFANYGRTNRETCTDLLTGDLQSVQCSAETRIYELNGVCNNMQTCSIIASNSVFGNPCWGTFKYLQVKYYCAKNHLFEENPLLEYQSLGCYRDTSDRAIPTLELHDYRLDGHYSRRSDVINKCANAAVVRGYNIFAVQNGAWCASSAYALESYDKYGASDACLDDGKGGPWANQVYVIIQDTLVCEHQLLEIKCRHGRLNIVWANYGRTAGGEICPHTAINTTKCRAKSSLDVVYDQCDGQKSCAIMASNTIFGDPCYGTFKYLQVKYTCTR
ncbi:uncharacterized protein LOC144353309 [Saccoglossus kowalevskii]